MCRARTVQAPVVLPALPRPAAVNADAVSVRSRLETMRKEVEQLQLKIRRTDKPAHAGAYTDARKQLWEALLSFSNRVSQVRPCTLLTFAGSLHPDCVAALMRGRSLYHISSFSDTQIYRSARSAAPLGSVRAWHAG